MALFWAAAIFALAMAVLPHPPEMPGHISDKIQHAFAFATLGVLGRWAYPRLWGLWLLVALSFYGAFIEAAQAIPALHRDSDPLDWVADTVACGLVVIATHFWKRRKS